MKEITADQIVLFFGACLFTIVVFLLKDLYASFKQLHNRLSEIEKKGISQRLANIEAQVKQYDANIEAFWKEFPRIVADSLAPHLNLISHQLDAISKRIDRLEDKEAKR